MAKSLRRRAIFAIAAFGMLAPTAGCQGGRLSAAKFAEGYIRAKVDKERLVAETCAVFATNGDAPQTAALQRDIEHAKRHDLQVLTRALCPANGCSADWMNATVRWPTAAQPNALLRVVLREVDKQAKTPEDFEKALQRVSRDGQAMAQILFKMNVARAGVFVALKLGDATQTLSDKLADSFGIIGGFARPVLEVVTSEIVAATMDQTFSLVETNFHVPRANFTEEACAIYKRSEPRASVATFILERAILRYAPPEKLDALVANGIALDCENLNQWIPRSALDESVCERIRLAVDTQTNAAAPSVAPADAPPLTPDVALRLLVKPVAPLPDFPDVGSYVELEADALRKSAEACADAYPNDREGACTLERVVRVASDAYARAIDNRTSVTSERMHFDDMEQRLAAIENDLVRTKDRLISDERRMQMHEAEQKTLRELVEAQQRRLVQLEQQLLDQRHLVNTILVQDQSLRKMSGQMSDLALLAYRTKCKEQYDNAYKARMQLARNLGFPLDICATPDSLKPLTANGMQIQPATYCRADLPIAIDFSFRFDAQVTVGNEKKCDSEVHCDDLHDKELCEPMRRIANELLATDFAIPPDMAARPYRFIGHASLLGVQVCEAAGRDAAKEMAQRGIVGLGGDSQQNGISYSRAKTSAQEFGKLVGAKTATFEVGKHADLVAAGTTHVTGIGNTAKPSDQEAFQREFQRLSMEIRAPRFVFTVEDCVNWK